MADAVLDLGRIVRRQALLERLERVRPDIVALIAPAGFGKSTLARQFAEGHQRSGICDCAGVGDDLDLARRLIPALADEDPDRGSALSQRELLLSEGTMSGDERLHLAVSAWRETPRPAAFIFENAEHVARAPRAREFLGRLLAERPASRVVVLCSRESTRLHLSRFAAPHRIVTLRADDLAFSRAEIDEIFAPLALDAAMLDRIYEISQGWQIPVLFLARLASEGRHEDVLDRLGDVAFEELYEYLADQVIDALPPPITDALFAAACIPHATATDLAFATGDERAAEILAEFARSAPFVRVSNDATYLVHPLMGAMLTENAGVRRDALLALTAERYGAAGDHLRAAELHFARPDHEAAARELEEVPAGDYRAPPMRYSRMVSELDRRVVRRYPTLWAWSALLQTFSTESELLLEETGLLWASLPPETPLYKCYYLLSTRVLLLNYLGRFDEALALIESVAPRAGIPEPPTMREHGYVLYLRGLILGRLGRLDEAEHDLDLAWPMNRTMDAMASGTLTVLGAEVARARGEALRERELLLRSLEYARSGELTNFVCFRLAELAIAAWLQGDEDGYARFVDELERIVERDGIRGFRFFTACARRRPAVPAGADTIRFILWGHLVAAGNAEAAADALRHARAACDLARDYPNPYLRALTSLAVAELASDGERSAAYAAARGFAEQVESRAFVDAVAAAAAGDASSTMLGTFVRRLRRRETPAAPRLDVSVLSGTVKVRGKAVKLGDRELELLLALARRREATSRDELMDTLWPESDEEAAANSLNVCLYRARQHLGDDGALERTRDGVRLCDDATVDLWEIERAVAAQRSREIADDADREAVRAVYQRLRVARPARFAAWEWFERVERYVQELRSTLAQRLARYALAKGRNAEALQLAEEMMEHDPCDEVAHEIAISAYLAKGDRPTALRQYRQYRELLLSELECEPSPSLTALLKA